MRQVIIFFALKRVLCNFIIDEVSHFFEAMSSNSLQEAIHVAAARSQVYEDPWQIDILVAQLALH